MKSVGFGDWRCGLTALCLLSYAAAGFGQTPKATGGNTTNTVGIYRVHTFTTTGSRTFVANQDLDVTVLIVGGGGGGGVNRDSGGGGGGGGVVLTNLSINADTYTFVVGGGGSGFLSSSSTQGKGTSGTNSSAFGVTAYAGGGGATGTAA